MNILRIAQTFKSSVAFLTRWITLSTNTLNTQVSIYWVQTKRATEGPHKFHRQLPSPVPLKPPDAFTLSTMMYSSNHSRRVSFSKSAPAIYMIASDLQTWQNGEVDQPPSETDVINAKALTLQSFAAASKQLEEGTKTLNYHRSPNFTPNQANQTTGIGSNVPARRPAISFAPTSTHQPDAPMAPPQLQRTRAIRRKEVPLRLVRSGNDALAGSASAQESFRPVTSRATTHRFEDFVPSNRIGDPKAGKPTTTRRIALGFSSLASKAMRTTVDITAKAAGRFENPVNESRANRAKREDG